MAVCRRCGNQMADTAAACPACGELRYQQPAAPQQPVYGAPQYQQQPQYPQQPYAAPQAAQQPQYAMPVTADQAAGFIGSLFDLSFTSFITTKLIKVLYIIAIIGAALEALAVIGVGFARGSMYGLVMLVTVAHRILRHRHLRPRVHGIGHRDLPPRRTPDRNRQEHQALRRARQKVLDIRVG